MNSLFVALGLALVAATCVFALELPEVKDQPGTPIDPKQIKNATVTFYNNGTYIYTLEVPCEAYLGQRGGASGRQQQQSGRQQQQQPHGDDHDDEHDDDDSDEPHHGQMTPQQRQQQQQQRQRQQQGQRSGSQSRGMSPHHEHLGPEELREAHKGTECECQCKNQQGEELDDVIRVSFGGAGKSQSSSSQRGGSRQDQQQRLQQRQQDRQRQRGSSGSSSQQKPRGAKMSSGEGEGPELVYPEQPRPGQKCIFFEEGEWENDDDELIDAVGPDHKQTGEPEEEVLEKCQFNFRKGGQQQQSSSSSQGGSQQASLQCTDHEGHQDQYVVRIVDGDLKPKLTPQQKQEMQQQKQQKSGAQRQQRSRQD